MGGGKKLLDAISNAKMVISVADSKIQTTGQTFLGAHLFRSAAKLVIGSLCNDS